LHGQKLFAGGLTQQPFEDFDKLHQENRLLVSDIVNSIWHPTGRWIRMLAIPVSGGAGQPFDSPASSASAAGSGRADDDRIGPGQVGKLSLTITTN
jgi:hypothetical protein